MKVAYIAGPFRAENAWLVEQNIRSAEAVGFRVAELGAMPLIPHTNTRFFDGTLTGQFWLDGIMELLRRCDAVVMCPGWRESKGSVEEATVATKLRLPVFQADGYGFEAAFTKWLDD